jgi:hypothetical protein
VPAPMTPTVLINAEPAEYAEAAEKSLFDLKYEWYFLCALRVLCGSVSRAGGNYQVATRTCVAEFSLITIVLVF